MAIPAAAPGRGRAGPRRSLIGTLAVAAQAMLRPRQAGKLAKAVAVVREHLMTIAALTAMDLGAFQVWHHGGWFAVAASILLLDLAVTG